MDLQHIRNTLRQKRRDLPAFQRLKAGVRLAQCLKRHPLARRAQNIGVYHASDGEIDLRHFVKWASSRGKTCYYPVVHSATHSRTMDFYKKSRFFKTGRFAIPVPSRGRAIAPRRLDWILVPLVAVDRVGHRLGRGKGYYDRYLKRMKRDLRIWGVAYRFQILDSVPARPWDVPVSGVATAQGLIWTHANPLHQRSSA